MLYIYDLDCVTFLHYFTFTVLSITQAGFDVIEGLLQEDEKRILSTLNDIESLLIENQVRV